MRNRDLEDVDQLIRIKIIKLKLIIINSIITNPNLRIKTKITNILKNTIITNLQTT
jgi:hypothetical protein